MMQCRTTFLTRSVPCELTELRDTMNTTSRLETTGKPGRIHLSHATASLLEKSGKGHWIKKRSDSVEAKGKGKLDT